MNEMLETLGRNAKEAEIVLRNLDTAKKNQVLEAVADSLVADSKALLTANAIDVENGRKNQMPEGLVDRLMLTEARIASMAEGLRQVAALEMCIRDRFTTALIRPLPPRGISTSTYSFIFMNSPAVSLEVSEISWIASFVIPFSSRVLRMQSTIAVLEWMASLPPFKITTLPVLKQRAKASAVTFGLAS